MNKKQKVIKQSDLFEKVGRSWHVSNDILTKMVKFSMAGTLILHMRRPCSFIQIPQIAMHLCQQSTCPLRGIRLIICQAV